MISKTPDVNDVTNITHWIVLADYEGRNCIIEAGTIGVNYFKDFERYAFMTKKNRLTFLGLDELLANPDSFKPEWWRERD